ncbi:hypothetical protein ACW7GZ_14505 [Luteimonas sp. A537]
MRPLLLTAMLFICGCSAEQSAATQAPEVLVPDYSLDGFGGHLIGTDRGEWIGKLLFQDADGHLTTLLNENVHGIIKNADGIFAFTGLAHLSLNEGYIYAVTQEPNGPVSVARLGRLPGAPTRVRQLQREGATSFLVYSGFSNNRQLFDCYQLAGKIVSRGHDC